MKYEKETNFQNAVFDQNMYCAGMNMYITCVCFFRKFCLIHGKELLSNVGMVSYLTKLFLPGKPEASWRQFTSI